MGLRPRGYEMTARTRPKRPKSRATGLDRSIRAGRSKQSSTIQPAKTSRLLPAPKRPTRTGGIVFDPQSFLAKAGLGKKILRLKKGEVAFVQGDPADAVFYVQKGQLRVTVISAKGKEATLSLVGSGEFLGENSLLSPHPVRLTTATAMNECVLLKIAKAEMVRVLHDESALSDMFVSFLLARNARIEADLVDQLFNSSEKRLARILLLLAQFGKESKPETVVPKNQPGGVGGDDWHHQVASQFFHESLPETGIHRIRRRDSGSQFPAQYLSARITTLRFEPEAPTPRATSSCAIRVSQGVQFCTAPETCHGYACN